MRELSAEETRAAEIAYARELWEKDRNAVIDAIESTKSQGASWPFVTLCLVPMLVGDKLLTIDDVKSTTEIDSKEPVDEKKPEEKPTSTLDKIIAMRIPQWQRKG